MKKIILSIILCHVFIFSIGQTHIAKPDTIIQKQYLAELQTAGRAFTRPFRQHYVEVYSMPDMAFLAKMDSARQTLFDVLERYRAKLDTPFVAEQELEINYYFDKLLVDYPGSYSSYTGKTYPYASAITSRLKHNLPDFNKPEMLSKADFTDYARAFFNMLMSYEVENTGYKNKDNRELLAIMNIIPRLISNKECSEFWRYDYLQSHIDNKGIKNIEPTYRQYLAMAKDTAHLRKIKALYQDDYTGRLGHLTKVYKIAGGFKLDMHIFLPDSLKVKNHPVMVYFHGGSWAEGKPDWFFDACKALAKKGWVACAVEYRIYGREGTLPFDAVMDARSAIRWLRQHAAGYNIDTSRIVAAGNSAGGHLVLATALADKWNGKTDNLRYSPVPNALMVISGVYDLTDSHTAFWRKTLANKNTIKEISPVFLVKRGMPPTLAIHATGDGNVPFESARAFEAEMNKAGNPIEFHAINGNNHFIWFDPRYAGTVNALEKDFLKKLGY